MPRLSRKLRVCKWVGTLGCALIATAFVGSLWWSLGFAEPSKQGSHCSHISNGVIWLMQSPGAIGPDGWLLSRSTARTQQDFPFTPFPGVDVKFGFLTVMAVPLWLPFLALLIPTLLLWRRDRKPLAGLCRRCNYDLTGNVSGRCPECGMAITEECYAPASHPAGFKPGASGESAAVKRNE